MRKPIIAITAQINYENGDLICRQSYVRQVLKSGGFPILLPPTEQPQQAAELFDGFILSGGGDIDAKRYGELPLYCENISDLRDDYEMELVAQILKSNKPLFAICRGIQVLNVAMGGTLYQDLPIQNPSEINHRMAKVSNKVQHNVRIMDASLLKTVLKSDKTMVNSYHHQAIKKVADGLKIAALADDEVIEAVYTPDQSFCLGVQWHPERLDNSDTENLFSAFISAAKK